MIIEPELKYYPDPCLVAQNKNVSIYDIDIISLSNTMIKIMRDNNGIGISAPQVGINLNMFVMQTNILLNPLIFINPQIRRFRGNLIKDIEGCLSLPGILVEINRFDIIDIDYYDINYIRQYRTFTGLESRVCQHEMDHLNSILISDGK